MTFSFAGHVSLFNEFVDRRQSIVDRIENTLLNVKDKETARHRDHAYFNQLLNACFFGVSGLPHDLLRLKGQLAARHLADGFEPVLLERYSHQLDPLELIVRAYIYWDDHRWPGKSARLTYAQAIYAVFVLRQLEYLSLTIWDDAEDQAADRLDTIQHLLERLNQGALPIFTRRSEWLMQTAQGPLTRHLEPYFRISERVDGSLTDGQRIEYRKAGARLAGGHLRSQLRYRVWSSGRPADDPELLAFVRNANSMDTALLVHDLVALLEAYDRATAAADAAATLDLADAILQGVSADPELFLTRLDLLEPCTVIEDVFIDGAAGRPRHTPTGHRRRGRRSSAARPAGRGPTGRSSTQRRPSAPADGSVAPPRRLRGLPTGNRRVETLRQILGERKHRVGLPRNQFSVGVLRRLSTTSTSNGALCASSFRPRLARPSNSDVGDGVPSSTRRASEDITRPAATAARINITL